VGISRSRSLDANRGIVRDQARDVRCLKRKKNRRPPCGFGHRKARRSPQNPPLLFSTLAVRLQCYLNRYKMRMFNNERPLEWIASSYKDLLALPPDVRRRFGYALSLAQMGDQDDAAKVLKGFGGAGVLEVIEDDTGGTYRAVYTVKFAEAVFVLHCFQKKSKSGIATPKGDMDIIRARLKVAEAWVQELRNAKTNH
jgi:phage-related protein